MNNPEPFHLDSFLSEIPEKKLEKPAIPFCDKIVAVGSRITCNPPAIGTDQDWLVLYSSVVYQEFMQDMHDAGWSIGGSKIPLEDNILPTDQQFNSFVLGENNVIATASPIFFQRFLAATSIAKRLNLRAKADRIALFQAVLYAQADASQALQDLASISENLELEF